MPQLPRGLSIEDVEADLCCALLTLPEARLFVQRRNVKPDVFREELHARVFRACLSLPARDLLVTPENVAHEVQCEIGTVRAIWARDGGLDRIIVPYEYATRLIVDHAAARYFEEQVRHLDGSVRDALANGDFQPIEVRLHHLLGSVQRFRTLRDDSADTVRTLMDRVDTTHYWLVPGVLERRDRLMIVAPEGTGKSFLLRQWAMMLACGAHWCTSTYSTYARVLVIDCENSEQQVARELRQLLSWADSYDKAWDERLRLRLVPQGLDLSRSSDVQLIANMLDTYRPDLLVIGPLYRLMGEADGWERSARDVQRVIDGWRVEYDCAVAIEHHAGHARDAQGQRDVRPMGSSAWLRWPEIGLSLHWDINDRAFTVSRFRGDRGGMRSFPPKLRHSGGEEWPWASDWRGHDGSRTRLQSIIDQELQLQHTLEGERHAAQ